MTNETYNTALRWISILAGFGAIIAFMIALAQQLWK